MTNISKNLLWLVVVVVVIGGFLLWQKQEPKELTTVRLGLQTAPAIGLVKWGSIMSAGQVGGFGSFGFSKLVNNFGGKIKKWTKTLIP